MSRNRADKSCTIAGCARPWYAREWCKPHYERWRKYGDANERRSLTGLPLEERFRLQWRTCEHGCWVWQGALVSAGYGVIWVDGQTRLAHRVAHELFIGPIPEGLEVDHVATRGCVHRACVNPAHLEAVTPQINVHRSGSPFGVNARKTHCKHGHEFTPENTRIQRGNQRSCRICQREAKRAHRARASQ